MTICYLYIYVEHDQAFQMKNCLFISSLKLRRNTFFVTTGI
jgi:hypothetical protein